MAFNSTDCPGDDPAGEIFKSKFSVGVGEGLGEGDGEGIAEGVVFGDGEGLGDGLGDGLGEGEGTTILLTSNETFLVALALPCSIITFGL
jgi:hypothetical protein